MIISAPINLDNDDNGEDQVDESENNKKGKGKAKVEDRRIEMAVAMKIVQA